MLPAVSSKLLVNQTVVADPSQPGLAPFDGMCGVAIPSPGVAAINLEKLGALTTTHFINWGPGVVQGEVTIEWADELANVNPWAAAPGSSVVTFTGTAPRVDTFVLPNTSGAIRHRITAPVVGGSVTTKIVGAV